MRLTAPNGRKLGVVYIMLEMMDVTEFDAVPVDDVAQAHDPAVAEPGEKEVTPDALHVAM